MGLSFPVSADIDIDTHPLSLRVDQHASERLLLSSFPPFLNEAPFPPVS